MQIFIPTDFNSCLSDKNVFIDNDFLSALFKNVDFFQKFAENYPSEFLLYDPLTAFEFLRDMYIPKERQLREDFISLDLFIEVTNHQQIFLQIQSNAVLLSKIYSHSNIRGASSFDLFLAGRIMIYPSENHLLITGNKKHFPDCIFDLITTITYYESEQYKNFSVLRFNKNKFHERMELIKSLDK